MLRKIIFTFIFSAGFLLISLPPNQAQAAAFAGIDLQITGSGFTEPVGAVHTGVGGDNRLFIVEQHTGKIRILNRNTGVVNATPFLDLGGQVSQSSEQGLLGLTFHPNYNSNGFFYVHFSELDGDHMIRRYTVSGNPDVANAGSAFTIMNFDQPASNHNGGDLKFGPDGFLYIALGDGGGGNDSFGNGQNKNSLLGKIIRIDVDGGSPYVSPSSNPFFGATPGADEIWAWGLRNPWRFSFDRSNGDLFIADVGQNQREEVNFQDSSSTGGENYGWVCKEGSLVYNPNSVSCPGPFVDPVAEYNHSFPPGGQGGCSITGGFIYRGTKFPALVGQYVYADFCSSVFYTTRDTGSGWDTTYQGLLLPTGQISSFGEDETGEIYVVDRLNGNIFHLVADPGTLPAPSRDSGKLVATTTVQTVNFATVFTSPPRVVAQITSEEGTEKAYLNITNVTNTSFNVQLQENLLTGYDGVHTPEQVSWYAIASSNNQIERARLSAADTANWRSISFGNTFASVPKVTATVNSEYGTDVVYALVRNVTTTGFQIRLEEPDGLDGVHRYENVAWTAFVTNSSAVASGTATGNQNWQVVLFPASLPYVPVLIAETMTDNDGDKAYIDIRGLTQIGFEFRIEEDPKTEDSLHNNETISWYTLAYSAPLRQSGTFSLGVNWTDIPYKVPFDGSVRIYSDVTTENGTDTVDVEIRSIGANKFQARLEEDLKAGWDGQHTNENITWLALAAAGSGELIGSINVGTTWTEVSTAAASFPGTAKIFAEIQTQNGTDTVGLDIRLVDNNSFEIKLEEDIGAGWDGNHMAENVAWLAFVNPSVGQTSTSSFDSNWSSNTLFGSPFASIPKMLAQINTDNNPETVNVDIRNLTISAFQARVEEEPKRYDGVHPAETVVWTAFP